MTAEPTPVVGKTNLHSEIKRGLAASVSILAIGLMATPAYAQIAPEDEDTIVVTGSRQVIQDAIALKRNNTQIVDGLSADEIGDIPALSIGEALENITGVASHRENGGATEVSIRGLGPYLSSTVVNGRAATNGSGDRSVNFSQFPSELINKLSVFKTQDASQIEGGVAGQIQLDTIKPLDFGKRRIQFEVKGNVNPDQLNQDDTEAGDIGYRLTGSYTDQFELGNGDVGFSIGGQLSDISQPEAESRQTGPTSDSRPACVISNGLAQFEDSIFGGTFTGFSNNPETEDRGDDDCDDFNDRDNDFSEDQRGSDTEGFDTEINPATGVAVDSGVPFVFAPSQRHFRQNDTRDKRDSLFGAVQWAPNDRLDVNIDGQWSERTQSEIRNDLTFNSGRRNDTSLNTGPNGETTTLDSLVVTEQGGILRSITDGNIEIQGGNFEREETYLGGGINVAYDISDRLRVAADYGYSNTERTENNQEFRIQSDISPVIEFDQRDVDVPFYTLYDEVFDVNDPTLFVDRLRVRIDNDLERENTIHSARFDVEYDLNGSFFTEVKAGVRWGQQDYLDLAGGADSGNPFDVNSGRFSFEIENDRELTINNQEIFDDQTAGLASNQGVQAALVDIIGQTNRACFNGTFNDDGTTTNDFPESDFLSSLRDSDQYLVTNVADDGTIISQTNSFATFDAQCVAETSTGALNGILDDLNAFFTSVPDGEDEVNSDAVRLADGGLIAAFSADIPELTEANVRTTDIRETTEAIYALANYETTLNGSLPISGNVGVRVVHTDLDATGYRPILNVSEENGEFSLAFGAVEQVSVSNSYTRVLPSANLIMDIADDKIVRLGVFRAMSRADPADLGFGRVVNSNSADDEEAEDSLEDLISSVTTNGNPLQDPLMSWNFDAAFEWYPNPDTILAIGGYAKSFQGGFENVTETVTFDLAGDAAGTSLTEDVVVQQVSDDTSQLYGFEVTASHAFTYLPGLLSGFGAKVSYNYATSDFEFEDSRYGDIFVEDANGNLVQTNEGIIDPASLPGLSENVLSAEVYYGIGGLDLSARYKYRDQYFQPFTSDGTRLRYVGDVGVWEARAAYKINDNFRVSVEAINLFSEPKEQFAFVDDDRYEINDYGPRIFFGLRGRF